MLLTIVRPFVRLAFAARRAWRRLLWEMEHADDPHPDDYDYAWADWREAQADGGEW